MATTVLVQEATRDALAATKAAYGASSIDVAIQRALRDATSTASELWRRHRKKAEAVLREHEVRRLIAFGSRVRDDRHPGSDLDLVAEFPARGGMRAFFDLREALTKALGVRVDLGDMPKEGSELWKTIQEEGVALVGPAP